MQARQRRFQDQAVLRLTPASRPSAARHLLGTWFTCRGYSRCTVFCVPPCRPVTPWLTRLLLIGKFDLADLDAIRMLRDAGLLTELKYLPPWATDLRFLASYLAYSMFLNEIDLGPVLF